MKLYMGADPGKSGALAVVAPDGAFVDVVRLSAPEARLVDWLRTYAPRVYRAALERVSARPGQGVTGMFRFGESYGLVKGMLAAHHVSYQLVEPIVWQREHALVARGHRNEPRSHKKRRHKDAAARLWPSVKITLATVDALLIAEWLRRTRP